MVIPKRLQVIGSLIHDGSNIADIGADHGLLEQYIALNFQNCKVLAIENKKGPLSSLRTNVGCLSNVTVSHSDGMNQVTKEYDTIVLAGMGGDNIINILSKDLGKLKYVKQIIVDAHSFIPKVRETIIGFGFDIEVEKLVFERNHYYNIISFKRNTVSNSYSKSDIEFGYKLYLDPLFEDYKNSIINKLKEVTKKLLKTDNHQSQINEINDEIRRLEAYGQN